MQFRASFLARFSFGKPRRFFSLLNTISSYSAAFFCVFSVKMRVLGSFLCAKKAVTLQRQTI